MNSFPQKTRVLSPGTARLVSVYFDFPNSADSQNLQRPLQPHTATPHSLADAAGAQRYTIVFG